MKVVVDEALCAAHGLCYAHAPEVFQPDEEGYNKDVGRTVDVPPHLEEAARRGARSCPEAAIRIVES